MADHAAIPPRGIDYDPLPIECPFCEALFAARAPVLAHLQKCHLSQWLDYRKALLGEIPDSPRPPLEVTRSINCRVCGELVPQITYGHLRRHGMRVAEYREQYVPTSKAEEVAQLLWHCVASERTTRWTRWLYAESRWGWRTFTTQGMAAVDASNTVPYGLKEADVLQHIRGLTRIAVWPAKSRRRWLALDVDAHGTPARRVRGMAGHERGFPEIEPSGNPLP